MVDPSYKSQLNTDFSGAWPAIDSPDVPIRNSLLSENVQFVPGQVRTRLGFSQAFDPEEAMTSMFNWISSLGNLLLWYRTSDHSVRMTNISSPSEITVINGDLLGYGATFAEAGARLYLSFFLSSQLGASGARVITDQTGSFVNDLCFRPPITYVPSAPSEPGSGTVTQGVHLLGYRVEYRSGFITRPSPDSGVGTPSVATFTPVSFTASGGANLQWSLTTTWPTGAVNVYAIMTPVANQADWHFIPGAVQSVVGGVSSTITFTIDISDDQLFATGAQATPSLFFLTNSVVDTPPFFPTVVLSHGNRMVYVTTVADNVGNQSGALFISNIGAYQEINAALSLVQLPGLKDIITAISLDGSLYIFGPQWTYRTADNGNDPVTWTTPILVDGRRGTLAVRGVEVAPSGTYAWVASQDGFYFFQGAYPALPVSYYQQTDWDRINWDIPNVIQIKDDPSVKKVYVMVCLDDSVTPNYLMTWDYTNGYSPEQVAYSLDFIQSYDLGTMEVVKNSLAGSVVAAIQRKELWLGSSSPAPVLRRNTSQDTDPYLDDSMPIFAQYETALYPHQGMRRAGEVYQHHGGDYRVKGSGQLQIIAYELDHKKSYPCLLIDLDTAPGAIIHRSFDLISEAVSHLFTQGQNLIVNPGFEN